MAQVLGGSGGNSLGGDALEFCRGFAHPSLSGTLDALRKGGNEVVVQASSFFNVNFNWAGFALRVIE